MKINRSTYFEVWDSLPDANECISNKITCLVDGAHESFGKNFSVEFNKIYGFGFAGYNVWDSGTITGGIDCFGPFLLESVQVRTYMLVKD